MLLLRPHGKPGLSPLLIPCLQRPSLHLAPRWGCAWHYLELAVTFTSILLSSTVILFHNVILLYYVYSANSQYKYKTCTRLKKSIKSKLLIMYIGAIVWGDTSPRSAANGSHLLQLLYDICLNPSHPGPLPIFVRNR